MMWAPAQENVTLMMSFGSSCQTCGIFKLLAIG